MFHVPARSRAMRRRARPGAPVRAALLTVAGLVLSACTSNGSAAPASGTVRVMVASSAAPALEAVAEEYPSGHREVRVEVAQGSSTRLAQQLALGAPADLLLTADRASMRQARQQGLVADPRVVASSRLVLVVPSDNPGNVGQLTDLTDPERRVVLCVPEAPCGAAARAFLADAGVSASVDSYATSAGQALATIALGEADAALLWEATLAGRDDVTVVPVPEAAPRTQYLAAVTVSATDPSAAGDLSRYLRSPAGQVVLRAHGLDPR